MKRYLILTFCLCALALAQAQTFNYTGLEIKQEKVKKKNVYEWENFILANYGYGLRDHDCDNQHSFGLTYGRVKLFGWYVNVMLGTGMHWGHKYSTDGDGIYENGEYIYPFYTGKTSHNHFSLAGGAVVRLVIPLYLYAGIGYGYQTITREINNGEWVLVKHHGHHSLSLGHSMEYEVGLQGNIKGFTLLAGYSFFTNYSEELMHEIKVGIGYTFKDKKK